MSQNAEVRPVDERIVLTTGAIATLEGRVLTLLDALISDPVQRKAAKDLARPMVWRWANEETTFESASKLVAQSVTKN